MKRLLTTLMILIIVLAAGMTALVVMINPNDFRHYLVEQAAENGDYQLSFNSDLRWHIWPTLSILTDNITLTPKKNSQKPLPTITAENMRLDVKLWPLFSHQLKIANIILKRAVIQLPYQQKPSINANNNENARLPVTVKGSPQLAIETSYFKKGWYWLVDNLDIEDSLLVWQESEHNAINFRQLNLHLQRQQDKQFYLTANSQISRNQRNLNINMTALINMADYPQNIHGNIEQFNYQLSGVGFPANGLQGSGNMQVTYQRSPDQLTLSPLSITINNNQFIGSFLANLADIADYQLQLSSKQVNIDSVLPEKTAEKSTSLLATKNIAIPSAPVISNAEMPTQSLPDLSHWNGKIRLSFDQLQYQQVKMQQVNLELTKQQREITLDNLQGKMDKGYFNIQGQLKQDDNPLPALTLQVNYRQLAIASLWQLLIQQPSYLTGEVSGSSQISLADFSQKAWWKRIEADNQMQMSDVSLQGFNLLQLIDHNIIQYLNKSSNNQEPILSTHLQNVNTRFYLKQGKMVVDSLQGISQQLQLQGQGVIDVDKQQCDMQLQLQLAKNWLTEQHLEGLLQNKQIPMHIYGPFSQLNYRVSFDKDLQNNLKQQLQQRLKDWLGKAR